MRGGNGGAGLGDVPSPVLDFAATATATAAAAASGGTVEVSFDDSSPWTDDV